MRFVHRRTGSLSVFTHALDRYAKLDADPEHIIACLAAFGLNIGLRDMAEISDVSYQEMVSTAHDFIRLENLKNGNDQVTNAMAKLPIFKYFNIEQETIHASMDGSKIDTQSNTFNARNSPKYFGLGKGVSSITLVANHIPVVARIIGAHEHESRFVYDLLITTRQMLIRKSFLRIRTEPTRSIMLFWTFSVTSLPHGIKTLPAIRRISVASVSSAVTKTIR
jgi:hypothetical protein